MRLRSRIFRWSREPLPELSRRIACFREVLHANNAALSFIADMQEALAGPKRITAAESCRMVTGVTVQTYRMVSNLLRMTGERHRALQPRFDALKTQLVAKIGLSSAPTPGGFIIPIADVGPCQADIVGQKSAYLGEARRILQGCIPEGFATTVDAYHAFMETDELGSRIANILETLNPLDVASCFESSARLVQIIEGGRVPDELREAVESAVSGLGGDTSLRLAVRSSALLEGGAEMSFAGQYRSLLNVAPHGVMDAFKKVIASKYSPQAITYRIGRGYDDGDVAMCCCVIPMVDAAAAGVLYTSFPTSSGVRTLLQAVRGLGLAAVDGSTEPATFLFDPVSRTILEVKPGLQSSMLRSAVLEGTEKISVGGEEAGRLPITSEQAVMVAVLAWRLEEALKMPLDIEWALDQHGRPFILQVRMLTDVPAHQGEPRKERIAGASVLIDRAARASGGVGTGPVCHVESDLDILRCPPGSVIVTREANPRFAVLLPRAAAIIADMGEVTGHLATVARELHVPALFATRGATRILKADATVTVDADAGVVYDGCVTPALASQPTELPAEAPDPNRELLQSVSSLIIPLTLRDRLASGYSPRKCKTIHDIIRFCHQATIEAMFDLGDSALREGHTLRRLVSPVPIDCRIFDLGGGLDRNAEGDKVTLDDVVCRPMRKLWQGMTDPRLRWKQLRPVSLRGFMSAVVDYNFDLDARLRPMGEPSYAFITHDYLNLNSRIGYHFSTVDARVCATVESNYASFRFAGGSTGIEQRSRRALLIQKLLDSHGFETDCRADLINARLRHRPPEEMDEALFLVGLLMGYVNHLDMALVSDATLKAYQDAFLAGDYGYKGEE